MFRKNQYDLFERLRVAMEMGIEPPNDSQIEETVKKVVD